MKRINFFCLIISANSFPEVTFMLMQKYMILFDEHCFWLLQGLLKTLQFFLADDYLALSVLNFRTSS